MSNRTILNKGSLLFAMVITLTLALSINSVYAKGQNGFSEHRFGNHSKSFIKKMAKHLELTEDQISQIKAIKSQAKADSASLKESMKSFQNQIKLLTDSSVFDEQAFNASYAQYQDTFAQIALTKAKTRHAIYYLLTPEQQEKWQSMKEKRKSKRANRNNDAKHN